MLTGGLRQNYAMQAAQRACPSFCFVNFLNKARDHHARLKSVIADSVAIFPIYTAFLCV
jgi:hypothetical protein